MNWIMSVTFTASAILKHIVSRGADTGEWAGGVYTRVLTQEVWEAALIQIYKSHTSQDTSRKHTSLTSHNHASKRQSCTLFYLCILPNKCRVFRDVCRPMYVLHWCLNKECYCMLYIMSLYLSCRLYLVLLHVYCPYMFNVQSRSTILWHFLIKQTWAHYTFN